MPAAARLRFDHDDRRRVYEFVERRGTVDRDAIRAGVGLSPTALRHHVAILLRDGRLRETEDGIQIGMGDGATEDHMAEGVPVTIRPARQADLGGIVGVIEQVVADGTYVEAESVAQVIDQEQVLLRFNQLESRMFFVATVDNEVVGWAHLAGSELAKLSHTAELTVGVLSAYRNRGIGSRLLDRAVTWAADREYERMYQSLPATNDRAIAFLQRHGWQIEAVRPDHYRIDGTLVDETMLAYLP